jgi:hypothetical protein
VTEPRLKTCPFCKGIGSFVSKLVPRTVIKCPDCDGLGRRFVCDEPGCIALPVQFDDVTGEGFCQSHVKGNL